MSTYSDKLKDPRWQKKRLEILQRDQFSCQNCGSETKSLNVHHWKYSKNPWEINDFFLITLCEECHNKIKTKTAILQEIVTDYIIDVNTGNSYIENLDSFTKWMRCIVCTDGPTMRPTEEIKETISVLLEKLETRGFVHGCDYMENYLKNKLK